MNHFMLPSRCKQQAYISSCRISAKERRMGGAVIISESMLDFCIKKNQKLILNIQEIIINLLENHCFNGNNFFYNYNEYIKFK